MTWNLPPGVTPADIDRLSECRCPECRQGEYDGDDEDPYAGEDDGDERMDLDRDDALTRAAPALPPLEPDVVPF